MCVWLRVCVRMYMCVVYVCVCVSCMNFHILLQFITFIAVCFCFCTFHTVFSLFQFTHYALTTTIIIDYFARRVLSLWLIYILYFSFFRFLSGQQIVIRVFVMVRAARNEQERR